MSEDDDLFCHSENWEEKYIDEREDENWCEKCQCEHLYWLHCSQVQWKNSQEYKDLYQANLKRGLDEVARLMKHE